jgi:hypothetical protein
MRLLILLLVITACNYLPKREPTPVQEPPVKQEPAAPKVPPSKPVTIITVNPPAKPQPMCVPLAVDQKKRILEALECAIEVEKAKK